MSALPNAFRSACLGSAGAAMLVVHCAALAQPAPQAIGIAAAVVKEVKVSNAQAPKPKQAAVRQRLALADLVQTGKASQLQILLLDQSTFSIGANASMRIDRFVYDPARGRTTGASVLKGAFRFMSGKSSPQNSATVNTPVATVGIRGTMLDGVIGKEAIRIAEKELPAAKNARSDPATATLIVLRGPGPGTDPREQVGAASVTAADVTVELTGPTQAVFVPRAGVPPMGPFNLSPKGIAQVNDQVQPASVAAAGSPILNVLLIAAPIVAGALLSGGSGGQATSADAANTAPRDGLK